MRYQGSFDDIIKHSLKHNFGYSYIFQNTTHELHMNLIYNYEIKVEWIAYLSAL
jgi:hypothetical protein